MKSSAELESEKKAILEAQLPYYRAELSVIEAVKNPSTLSLPIFDLPASSNQYKVLYDFGLLLLDQIYLNGVLPLGFDQKMGKVFF